MFHRTKCHPYKLHVECCNNDTRKIIVMAKIIVVVGCVAWLAIQITGKAAPEVDSLY